MNKSDDFSVLEQVRNSLSLDVKECRPSLQGPKQRQSDQFFRVNINACLQQNGS